MRTKTDLEGYIKQAERFGTDEVFETALDEGLGLRELGTLALRLQNLNPSWKLTSEAQHLFVGALIRGGRSIKDAARIAGVGYSTAKQWVAEDLDDADEGPEMALRRASKARFEDLKGIVRGWHRTS